MNDLDDAVQDDDSGSEICVYASCCRRDVCEFTDSTNEERSGRCLLYMAKMNSYHPFQSVWPS